jgi:tRNA (guanine-N7-)-methyltransferase
MGNDERMRAQPTVDEATSPTPPEACPPAQHNTRNYPRTTSFRTRRSALSAAQQRTWERLWPELGTHARSTDGPGEPLDTRAWFGREAPLVLEIGCGTGTSTVAMAQSEPDVDVIAVEVYRRGLAQLLCAIEREKVSNIRLIRGDAVDVLEHLITPGSLSGVRVFFPDPWPKTRHHKRRLLQPATVALIADRLRPGGVLHAATDHPGYAEQIADVGDAEPRLRRLDPAGRPVAIAVVRPTTKYETKARHAGSAVTELLWDRRSERNSP